MLACVSVQLVAGPCTVFSEGLTDICSINEAEQIHQGHCGHDVQVNLPPESGLGLLVKLDQGMSVLIGRKMAAFRRIMSTFRHERFLVMGDDFVIPSGLGVGDGSSHDEGSTRGEVQSRIWGERKSENKELCCQGVMGNYHQKGPSYDPL